MVDSDVFQIEQSVRVCVCVCVAMGAVAQSGCEHLPQVYTMDSSL